MRQLFHLLGHPLPGERLQGLDDAGMQHSTPLQQETAIGHVVGEGMLEGEGVLGERPRLIEKLGRLQAGQAMRQPSSGASARAYSRGKGTSVPITAAVCNRCLSSGGSRSIRAISTACTVAGTWMVRTGCARR